MHGFILLLAGVMSLAAVITIISLLVDDNLAPVGKTFASLFVGCCALVLVLQTVIDNPAQAYRLEAVADVGQLAGPVDNGAVIERERAVPGQVVQAPAAVAAGQPAGQVVVAQPEHDSTKDMLLGGALGYALGSAGRGNGGQAVTSHTTVIHSSPPAPTTQAPPSSPRVSPRPPAARATFRNTFSMTRRR